MHPSVSPASSRSKRRKSGSTSSAGTAGLNRKPWPSVQPSRFRNSHCSGVSMPSASASAPMLRASWMIVVAMAFA